MFDGPKGCASHFTRTKHVVGPRFAWPQAENRNAKVSPNGTRNTPPRTSVPILFDFGVLHYLLKDARQLLRLGARNFLEPGICALKKLATFPLSVTPR